MRFTSNSSWAQDIFKARELRQPKWVPFFISWHFLGRIDNFLDKPIRTEFNLPSLCISQELVFPKGTIKMVDTFWVATWILPNTFKNEFQLGKVGDIFKMGMDLLFIWKWRDQMIHYIVVLAHMSPCKFLLNFTTEFCSNFNTNSSGQNGISGHKSAVTIQCAPFSISKGL